jgi:hypothetical protein
MVASRELPGDVAWFELGGTGPTTHGRLFMPPPPPVPVGSASTSRPTAAVSYLAQLSAQHPPAEIGQGDGKQIVAGVAAALLYAGAIPPDSPVLTQVLAREKRSRHPVLPASWPTPIRRTTQPHTRIATCAALPFDSAAVVLEGLSAWGEEVQLHVYGWPWVQGERWPAAIPSFTLRAIDDLGGEHEGRPGNRRDYGDGEGHADFTLWPAVPAGVSRLRVEVSTLWEAAWADLEL